MAPRPPKPRSTIAVEVHGFRRYRPGCGPPLQPITLVPRRDSTAYIVNKLVTPVGIEIGPEVQRRMNYLIGWTDLPAARATVPATHILDYVSPAELEEWEYGELLRREEEERTRAEEATKAAIPRKPNGRPRGRPPRAQLAEQSVETPELSASEEALIAHKKASGPSLSTPKKRTLHELMHAERHVEETGDSEDSDETAIMRQLHSESVAQSSCKEEDESGSDVDILDIGEGALGRMQARTRPAAPPLADVSRSSSVMPAPASASGYATATGNSRRKMDTGQDEGKWKRPAKVLKTQLSSSPSSFKTLPPQRKETSVPPPKIPPPRAPSSSLPYSRQTTASSTPTCPLFTKPLGGSQPVPNAVPLIRPTPLKRNGSLRSSQASSSPEPSADPALLRRRRQKLASRGSRTPDPTSSKSSGPTNGARETLSRSTSFTPAASSPHVTPSQPRLISSTPIPVPEIPAPKSTTKKTPARAAPAPEEQSWEVKTLLGERRRYDDKNKLIHEYKVLWAGNWPPDENPTWEPERNVPKKLIEEYHKKAFQNKKQRTLLSYMPKRRFSNVAEAFAGELGEEDEVPSAIEQDEDEDDGEDAGDEQLLVTEDKAFSSHPSSGKRSTPILKRVDVASFRGV